MLGLCLVKGCLGTLGGGVTFFRFRNKMPPRFNKFGSRSGVWSGGPVKRWNRSAGAIDICFYLGIVPATQ